MKKKFGDYAHFYLGIDMKVLGDWYWFPDASDSISVLGNKYARLSAALLADFAEDIFRLDVNFKPLLRLLKDMTIEERKEYVRIGDILNEIGANLDILDSPDGGWSYAFTHKVTLKKITRKIVFFHMQSDQFIYLLQNGFDLFGFIRLGQALDRAKVLVEKKK